MPDNMATLKQVREWAEGVGLKVEYDTETHIWYLRNNMGHALARDKDVEAFKWRVRLIRTWHEANK